MMEIRNPTRDEIEELIEFKKKFSDFPEKRFREFVKNNHDLVYIAFEESIVGFSYGYLWREDIGAIKEVRAMQTDGEISLVETMEEMFKKKNCRNVRVWIDENQERLKEYLLTHGYHITTELLSFEKSDLMYPTKGNPDVTIKKFEERYIDEVMKIEETCFSPEWQTSREGLLHPPKNIIFDLAFYDKKVIGYLMVSAEEERGHYARVAVVPEFRRRGIGSRLTYEAIKFFREENVKKISLRTPKDDIPAQNLYKKFGFREVGAEYDLMKEI